MRPEEAQTIGLWDDLGHGEGGVSTNSVRVSPNVLFVPRQLPDRACLLSSIVLILRGELDYTNLEVMQLCLLSESICQLPGAPFMFLCRQLSGAWESGLGLMLR